MPHHSQNTRKKNMELVVKMIATTMPNGAQHSKLLAMLATKYGFLPHTANQYLNELRTSERITWYPDKQLWKLPTA